MPHPRRRYKILIDEDFYPRTYFPITNAWHDLKHIAVDFKKTGLTDMEVYDFAIKAKRLILTGNIKDFREMAANSKDTGIIGVTPNKKSITIDKDLMALLRRKTKSELFGHYTTLS